MEIQVAQEQVPVVQEWLKIEIKADIKPDAHMVAAWYDSIPVIVNAEVNPDGAVRVQKVTVYPPGRDEGHGVTRAVLREVAAEFDGLLVEAMRQAGVLDEGQSAEHAFLRQRGEQDPIVRRETTGDHLGRVAAIYKEAEGKSLSGLRAVMVAFPGRGKTGRASKTTASRWIRQAREAGLLEWRNAQ